MQYDSENHDNHHYDLLLISDIKPENIMCQTKSSTNVKLIDFGLATRLDPNEVVKISTGTAEFAAPEIVEREPVGFYTDMWAVGVLAYVLLVNFFYIDTVFYFSPLCDSKHNFVIAA